MSTQTRWQTLSRLAKSLVSMGRSEVSAEERRLLVEHERKNAYAIARVVCPWAAPLLLFSVLPCLIFPPFYQQKILSLTHLALGLLTMSWLPAQRLTRLDTRWVILLMEVIALAGYGESIHAAVMAGPDVVSFVFGNILYISSMLLCLLLFPFGNTGVFLIAVVYVAIGAFAWRGEPYHKLADWITVESLIALFGIGVYYGSLMRRQRQLQSELAARSLIIQSERSRLASVEQDLSLAGEMQTNFNSEEPVPAGDHFHAHFYQEKFGVLSGDWTATKTLPNGDFILVVADATGKGVRAAMVTQALQTLWINGLAENECDPEAWIRKVNLTLLGFGARRDHTATLGFVLIRGEMIHYYSAAHLPLFLICRHGTSTQVLPLLARGSLLGLDSEVELTPVSINLTDAGVSAMLLGTDGVFERGARTTRQAVLRLAADLAAQGTKALERCPAADDKLVVWLQRNDHQATESSGNAA